MYCTRKICEKFINYLWNLLRQCMKYPLPLVFSVNDLPISLVWGGGKISLKMRLFLIGIQSIFPTSAYVYGDSRNSVGTLKTVEFRGIPLLFKAPKEFRKRLTYVVFRFLMFLYWMCGEFLYFRGSHEGKYRPGCSDLNWFDENGL